MTFTEYIESLPRKERRAHNRAVKKLKRVLRNSPPPSADFWSHLNDTANCPNRENHRGPEGPNEDMATCHRCNFFSFSMRPAGETWGAHIADCSLPINHQSYCKGGGLGHPEGKVRG